MLAFVSDARSRGETEGSESCDTWVIKLSIPFKDDSNECNVHILPTGSIDNTTLLLDIECLLINDQQ
jgi:hypothetical protein